MNLKLDQTARRLKTNIKIKDIDFGLHRAKLKITTGRQSERSVSSKDSNGRDEDEDYYEEM